MESVWVDLWVTSPISDLNTDFPSLFIRGRQTFQDNSVLVLVDGFESNWFTLLPEEIESVDIFMNDNEGYGESSMYFFDNDEDPATTTEQDVENWVKQEISYYLFSKPDEFPSK